VLLARYREVLSGRVLELGCGAGRLLGYFLTLGAQAHGIDLAPAMVEYCRRVYPTADVRVGDLRSVGEWDGGGLDSVFASYNVLDVLDDAERRRVLAAIRELIAPGGILIFSSHNLEAVDGAAEAGARPVLARARALGQKLLDRPPAAVLRALRRTPRRLRNRRRLVKLERRTDNYAILNDIAQDYGLLHYYIGRDEQERQLEQLGYELLECLDLEGFPVPHGAGSRSTELHYVARPRI